MWKKEDGQDAQPTGENTSPVATPRSRTTTAGSGRATIGPSISIRGDVTGSEDLLIQGRIDGSVTLDDHSVGVGSEGRVTANITGRLITIEGRVEGDLTAQEQIVLRGSAHVKGDIKAPRVVLEDGATFRGLVDMGSPQGKSKDSAGTAASQSSGSRPDSGDAAKSGSSSTSRPDVKPSSASSGSTGGSSATSSSPSSSSGKGKDPSKADQASA